MMLLIERAFMKKYPPAQTLFKTEKIKYSLTGSQKHDIPLHIESNWFFCDSEYIKTKFFLIVRTILHTLVNESS